MTAARTLPREIHPQAHGFSRAFGAGARASDSVHVAAFGPAPLEGKSFHRNTFSPGDARITRQDMRFTWQNYIYKYSQVINWLKIG
jgi:hypothetical protein